MRSTNRCHRSRPLWDRHLLQFRRRNKALTMPSIPEASLVKVRRLLTWRGCLSEMRHRLIVGSKVGGSEQDPARSKRARTHMHAWGRTSLGTSTFDGTAVAVCKACLFRVSSGLVSRHGRTSLQLRLAPCLRTLLALFAFDIHGLLGALVVCRTGNSMPLSFFFLL